MDLAAHLSTESARFLDVLRDTDPSASVPSCPGWTAADLLWHLGEVQHFWSTVIETRPRRPERGVEPPRPEAWSDLVAFFAGSSARLQGALAAAEDDEPAWTWFPPAQTVGFTRRRQVHEALVHRLDAELTAGLPSEIDAEVATDGVGEVLETMFSGVPPWGRGRLDGPLGALTTTDTGATWFVQVGHWDGTSPGSGTSYLDEPYLEVFTDGDPAFTVTAPAGDLDAWLWNRPVGTARMVTAGDVGPFEALIRTGVQ